MGRSKNYKSPSSIKRSTARLVKYLIKITKTNRNMICITHEEENMTKDNSAILPDHNIDTSRIPGNSSDIIGSRSFLTSTLVRFNKI